MTNGYRVGYRKPPRETQFQKGQSGNPKGRPKGSKNLLTDVLEEMAERIPIREAGTDKHVTKQRAMVKALTAKALKGDTRAAAQVIGLLAKSLDLSPNASAEKDNLSATDQEIIDRYLERALKESCSPDPSQPRDPDTG